MSASVHVINWIYKTSWGKTFKCDAVTSILSCFIIHNEFNNWNHVPEQKCNIIFITML